MLTHKKIQATLKRFRYIKAHYGETIVMGFSGGKDSQCLALLAKEAGTQFIKTMYKHTWENGKSEVLPYGFEDNTIVFNSKKDTIPFLTMTNIVGQIDGTRMDEEGKPVVFNGKEIARNTMPDWYTENGVFGMKVFYPIYDWTEEEVYEYLGWGQDEIDHYKTYNPN